MARCDDAPDVRRLGRTNPGLTEYPGPQGKPMKINVRLFALYRERAGAGHLTLDLAPGSTLADVVGEIRNLYPQLAPPAVRIVAAVNAEYTEGDVPLYEGDEVALIPPVSGGCAMVTITHDVLDPEAITAKVRREANGAVVTFLGVTRLYAEGKKVLYLEYEAFIEMAQKKLEEIMTQLQAEWNIEDIAVAHRIGRVDIGEISLVVAVASPHRYEAFMACHQAVDRLKVQVPIWKKEYFEGGHHWVACEDHEHESSAVPKQPA